MTARRGAYGMAIPDGVCGTYVADEGGEWWCRRALGHRGDCLPYTLAADGHAHAARVAQQARLHRGQWANIGNGLQVRLG